MPEWIETEIKLLLPDEAAFRRVEDALGPREGVLQRNDFFDVEGGGLRAARIGVRLRAEGETRRLTLKGDLPDAASDAPLARRIELETEMTPVEFDAARADGLDLAPWLARFEVEAGPGPLPAALARFLKAIRSACGDRPLHRYAGFVNRRALHRLERTDEAGPLSIELALDRTEFPNGRIDHEIEVELGPEAADDPALARRIERALARWLAELGAGDVLPAPSKLARLHRVLDGAPADRPVDAEPGARR
jgi:hypothetical protein